MKKLLAILLVAAMLLGAVAAFSSCTKKKDTFTVGVCQLVQHVALDAATQGFIDALKAEFGDKVTILEEKGDGTPATCTTIVNNFVSKKVDLIMANATPALQAAANATTTIPVLGTSITEYGTALGIENFSGTVGGNVSGTSDLAPLDQQAAMVKELFPEATKVAILFCTAEANSLYQVKVVKAELEKAGITVEECGFTDSNDVTVAAQKAAQADVIYIPTDNTCASCAAVIDGVIGDTPVIAGEEGICKVCGVATLSISYYNLGVTTGKMAVKILKGEAKVANMAVEYDTAPVKKFNVEKCAQAGIDTAALTAKGYEAIK